MSLLLGLATMFIALGVGILWKQSRARSCNLHSRTAGHVAVVLAFVALVIGLSILLHVLRQN